MEDYVYKISNDLTELKCAEPVVKYGSDKSDNLMEIIDFLISSIRSKYPYLEVSLRKDAEYDHYNIIVDDHKTYYSYDFTVMLGEFDLYYLIPNDIYNVFFIVDYSQKREDTSLECYNVELTVKDSCDRISIENEPKYEMNQLNNVFYFNKMVA
jgi:hypothetical protein